MILDIFDVSTVRLDGLSLTGATLLLEYIHITVGGNKDIPHIIEKLFQWWSPLSKWFLTLNNY